MNNTSCCPDHNVMTDTQAKLEASRCLMCDDPPCVEACPANVPVKHFIRAIRFGTPRRAINLIRDRNVLAGICGLACPTEKTCVGACRSTELTTPIDIGGLQHYAAATELQTKRPGPKGPADGKNVAIIGSGPSGLSAAAELATLGHKPTIFEKNNRPGGICTYGVPPHRLPQTLVAGEVEYIRSLGVEIKTNETFGGSRDIDSLFAEGYEAVYIAAGAQKAFTPKIPGEELQGVTTWKDLLDACSVAALDNGPAPKVAKSVIIVGGGSVAMDVATTVIRMGAEEVDLVCLESPREMPADKQELEEATEAGVRFHTRSMPMEVTGQSGKATGLKSIRIRWKEPDKFVPSNAERIEGTEFHLPAEMIVFAIGAAPDPQLAEALTGVKTNGGRIVADPETGATSRPGVFAGGDNKQNGGATIVNAVAEGKRAAKAIDEYLNA